uniref:RNA binding motif protein 4B n=1 Tax=Sus scrofa TaxID=9823 RepID=A0A8D0TJ65_PIG
MVKLFIGNLPREATEQEIRSLFEQYGKVLECDIIKNYGFVHIEDKTAAEDAIRNLHHYKLHGVNINVEASKNKSKASTKLHVGNISPTCTNQELRAKFEEYGPVIECDIVKDYAFVHMERAEDAVEAIRGLDNTEFQGELPWGLDCMFTTLKHNLLLEKQTLLLFTFAKMFLSNFVESQTVGVTLSCSLHSLKCCWKFNLPGPMSTSWERGGRRPVAYLLLL